MTVVDQPATTFAGANLEVVEAEVLSVDLRGKSVKLSTGTTYTYDKLCLCTGARPKVGPAVAQAAPEASVGQTRDNKWLGHRKFLAATVLGSKFFETGTRSQNLQSSWHAAGKSWSLAMGA